MMSASSQCRHHDTDLCRVRLWTDTVRLKADPTCLVRGVRLQPNQHDRPEGERYSYVGSGFSRTRFASASAGVTAGKPGAAISMLRRRDSHYDWSSRRTL